MELKSAIYDCTVFHHRMQPKQHRFNYDVYMLWLDLDELDVLDQALRFFGRNRFSLLSFYDEDHFKVAPGAIHNGNTRQNVEEWLQNNQIERPDSIRLLTNARVLGYVFNPVSFYYCYDSAGTCYCILAEVSNTFGEMKIFTILPNAEGHFQYEEDKYFYVSPFTELDDRFHFQFKMPGDSYYTSINVSRAGELYFYSSVNGKKSTLSDAAIVRRCLRLPFVTLKIISGIHWQAFRIWLKGIHYHKKAENQDLQRDVINK
ncbi:MAG TPA: DUF1365 domain-containing protein [Bacteroidetes bacterium]|nr:DUF1365 domain-containing protein [Bacteroidota bacterium]